MWEVVSLSLKTFYHTVPRHNHRPQVEVIIYYHYGPACAHELTSDTHFSCNTSAISVSRSIWATWRAAKERITNVFCIVLSKHKPCRYGDSKSSLLKHSWKPARCHAVVQIWPVVHFVSINRIWTLFCLRAALALLAYCIRFTMEMKSAIHLYSPECAIFVIKGLKSRSWNLPVYNITLFHIKTCAGTFNLDYTLALYRVKMCTACHTGFKPSCVCTLVFACSIIYAITHRCVYTTAHVHVHA